MTNFYKEQRRADDKFLKAAALAGAFEQWRLKQGRQVPLPRSFRSVLPLSVEELAPRMEQSRRRADHRPLAFESIRACLEHQLANCGHPHHERFRDACPQEAGSPYERFGLTDTDIEFNAQTFVTQVVVRSVFKDVSRDQALDIATMADPPNWDDAAPTFFTETARVEIDASTGDFHVANPPAVGNGNGRSLASPSPYFLYERVEWDWSPLLTGGIINLLKITPAEDSYDARSFLKDVFDKVGMENRPALGETRSEPPETLIAYRYELEECIQSKFVGGWEPKGLDTDEGSYRAVWLPQGDRLGTLVMRAEKSINYSSKAAELFPGLSSLLNLLAPALTSMLMNHLTFYGPCSFLATGQLPEAELPPAGSDKSIRSSL